MVAPQHIFLGQIMVASFTALGDEPRQTMCYSTTAITTAIAIAVWCGSEQCASGKGY